MSCRSGKDSSGPRNSPRRVGLACTLGQRGNDCRMALSLPLSVDGYSDLKGWVVMKRFVLLTVAALALLVPTIADAAQAPFVYRPELRQWVPVPPEPGKGVTTRTLREEIARHQAMAQAHRGTRMAQAAVHCDQQANRTLRD